MYNKKDIEVNIVDEDTNEVMLEIPYDLLTDHLGVGSHIDIIKKNDRHDYVIMKITPVFETGEDHFIIDVDVRNQGKKNVVK